MEQTGWQRTWVRVLLTILTAAVMLLIFFFSNVAINTVLSSVFSLFCHLSKPYMAIGR